MKKGTSMLDKQLIGHIWNSSAADVYPFTLLTYMAIRKTRTQHCAKAYELLRYIKWFLFEPTAREICAEHMMVPMNEKITNEVIIRVE